MEVKLKILFSVMALFGALILIHMMKFINLHLKYGLMKRSPKLLESNSWFFGKKKENFIRYSIIIMTIIYLLLIWFDIVIIPIE
jgi:hypothetical protein